MHIELTEMLRCPEPHELDVLVLSTGEILGRMVRTGIVGCPVCRKEYPIVKGIVDFGGRGRGEEGRGHQSSDESRRTLPPSLFPLPDSQTLQALLDLSGPGGFVVLVGDAARAAQGLATVMGGIHFVGVNAPADVAESAILSLLVAPGLIPLRPAMARGVVVGADRSGGPWLEEAQRVLLRGRRLVIEGEAIAPPPGVARLAVGQGLWVGEKA
jgi:uncharacterized protein YbaR (Trm112 family)